MKNQFQQGKFEGSLDVTLELSLSLQAGGGGERREGPGSVMLGRRVASPGRHLGPIGLRVADTHPRRARGTAAEPGGAARRRAQAGCRAPATAAPRSWWCSPRAARGRRGRADAGATARDAAGVAAWSAGTHELPGVSVAPPRRLQSGSAFAPSTWEPRCQKGLCPGPEGGQCTPRGEDGRHSGLTGRRLTDRPFFKRTVFLNEEGKLLIC